MAHLKGIWLTQCRVSMNAVAKSSFLLIQQDKDVHSSLVVQASNSVKRQKNEIKRNLVLKIASRALHSQGYVTISIENGRESTCGH